MRCEGEKLGDGVDAVVRAGIGEVGGAQRELEIEAVSAIGADAGGGECILLQGRQRGRQGSRS